MVEAVVVMAAVVVAIVADRVVVAVLVMMVTPICVHFRDFRTKGKGELYE